MDTINYIIELNVLRFRGKVFMLYMLVYQEHMKKKRVLQVVDSSLGMA